MKILCVSDYVDPLIYNPNLKQAFPDIDLVLCAGDLPMDYIDFIVTVLNKPTYFVFGNHNLKELKYYEVTPDHLRGGAKPFPQPEKCAHGATYLGFKTEVNHKLSYIDPKTGKKTPLLIAGISGSSKYNNGACQYTDREMKHHLKKLGLRLLWNKIRYGRYLDIFLTHATPRHIHDHEDPCHVGFESFNWFLQKYKPSLMIHGHIHLYDMREERSGIYYDTKIVNAYAHCIIDFPDDTVITNN
ncbi:MAG: metallophosphoesterase [Treponema sp.]|nr:metallophosphoesterase [Treponema sp.]